MLARRSIFSSFLEPFSTSGDFWLDFSLPKNFEPVTASTDVYEKGGKLITELEVPGFTKKDITVKIDKRILTVEAKKENKKEDKNKNYFRSERINSFIKRSFVLPKDVSVEGVDTILRDGVLTITFDKLLKEKEKPKEIEIKTE